MFSNRTEQNRTEQNRTEQNRTEQNRTEHLDYLGQGLFVKPFFKSLLIFKESVGSFCVHLFSSVKCEGTWIL